MPTTAPLSFSAARHGTRYAIDTLYRYEIAKLITTSGKTCGHRITIRRVGGGETPVHAETFKHLDEAMDACTVWARTHDSGRSDDTRLLFRNISRTHAVADRDGATYEVAAILDATGAATGWRASIYMGRHTKRVHEQRFVTRDAAVAHLQHHAANLATPAARRAARRGAMA